MRRALSPMVRRLPRLPSPVVLLLAGSALASSLVGCGEFPPDLHGDGSTADLGFAVPDGGAQLTLGTLGPDGGFATLSDGEDVTLVPGAQGGFHVWMMFRFRGAAPMEVKMTRTAQRVSDGEWVLRANNELNVGQADAAGDWDTPMATPMFMCPSPIGVKIIDTPIHFSVTVSSENDAPIAAQQIDLVPHCPDAQRDFCVMICSG